MLLSEIILKMQKLPSITKRRQNDGAVSQERCQILTQFQNVKWFLGLIHEICKVSSISENFFSLVVKGLNMVVKCSSCRQCPLSSSNIECGREHT